MSKGEVERLPWNAQLLRLSAFTISEHDFAGLAWWATIIGELPETRIENPRTHGLLELGPFHDRSLALELQPGRIDWFLRPSDEEGDAPPAGEFRLIGPFTDWIELFSGAMQKWFPLAPPIKRLAIGTVLLHPVPTRHAAYLELMDLTPVREIDTPDASEFYYQINRPRYSVTKPELRINRLSKWSAGGSARTEFTIHPDASDVSTSIWSYATRVELDVNTDMNHSEDLPLSDLWAELTSLAEEIAELGDIP